MQLIPYLRFSAALAASLTMTSGAAAESELAAKQVAAPATDIRDGTVVLPRPEDVATRSAATIQRVEFAYEIGVGWVAEREIAIDAPGPVAIACVALGARDWSLAIARRDGAFVPIAGATDTSAEVDVARFDLLDAAPGAYRIRVTRDASVPGAMPAPGHLIVRTRSATLITAHTTTLSTLSDREFGIRARLVASDAEPEAHEFARWARTGRVRLESDAGTSELVLADDGAHADGVASDGVFGAIVPAGLHGHVRAWVDLAGETPSGVLLTRTACLAFDVVLPRAAFDGQVDARADVDGRVRIEFGALPLGPAAKLHVSAEVWGTDEHGDLAPACWLSRMLEPEVAADGWRLALFLDTRWLDVARVRAPFAIRNARIQDPDTSVPFDVAKWLALDMPALPPFPARAVPAITPQMQTGFAHATSGRPVHYGMASPVASFAFSPTLLLVHGWCSGGSIWPAADFTQPKLEFLDPNANRTHDQFALLIAQAGAGNTSYGIVAHSQGGMAALHLYTYYVSGLDFASGPRRIQSLCTPYLGTPLASLGFFSCGNNSGLTTSGAATWLAGIPNWARSEVWYWTVTEGSSVCNGLTNIFLSGPDDGVVQLANGQLSGAHSMGNVTSWCHSTGLNYPAAYTDLARNAQLNAQAAR